LWVSELDDATNDVDDGTTPAKIPSKKIKIKIIVILIVMKILRKYSNNNYKKAWK